MSLIGNTDIILVSGGKGGVGKSTISAGLAKSLAKTGLNVGLLDADVSGPSQHYLFPDAKMVAHENKLLPALIDGVYVASMGYLSESTSAIVWSDDIGRGLMSTLLNNVLWGKLDLLVVDLPPSTSPVTRILLEFIEKAWVVFVTTGSALSMADCKRDIMFHRRLETYPLGIVENLSYVLCPDCNKKLHLFDSYEVEKIAAGNGLEVLSQFPFSNTILSYGIMDTLAERCILAIKNSDKVG